MKLQIPIFRAKKIDRDEYVIGYYVFSSIDRETHLIRDMNETYWEDSGLVYVEQEIDLSTLSIHFPDISSTQSEKVWYNMEEVSNIIKECENGKMESN